METKKYTRAQLIDALEIQCNLSNIRGTLKDVQQLTLQNNLPIQFTQKKNIEGWHTKPKGMLQILWERGWIDPSKSVRDYSINGKKIHKDSNDIIPGLNLRQLISDLPDFKAELILLQYRAQQLGVQACCSPQYHPRFLARQSKSVGPLQKTGTATTNWRISRQK